MSPSRKQQLSVTTGKVLHLSPTASVTLLPLQSSFTFQHVDTHEVTKRRAPYPDRERDSGGGDRGASWADVGEARLKDGGRERRDR